MGKFKSVYKFYYFFPKCCIISLIFLFGISLIQFKTGDEKIKLNLFSTWNGVFDKTGEYKTFNSIITADNQSNLLKNQLCVAIQTSFDRLSEIVDFLNSWHGPLSLSIFTVENDYFLTLNYIQYLRKCNRKFRDQVTVHITININYPPNYDINNSMNFNCIKNPKIMHKELLKLSKNKNNKILYPQNLLRNIARVNCQNKYIMCPDIDMILTHNSQQLDKFLTTKTVRECNKCAFVIPVYEINNNCTNLPRNKMELIRFIKMDCAREFHKVLFSKNQGQSLLNKLQNLSLKNNSEITIAYEVFHKFWYEPVYIARRGAPLFDERYVGYGMVRNTQVFEMSLAGYKFKLLDNIFLNHWGYQIDNQSIVRKTQTKHNFQLFVNTHLEELAIRYNADPENLLKQYAEFTRNNSIVAVKKNIETHNKKTTKLHNK